MENDMWISVEEGVVQLTFGPGMLPGAAPGRSEASRVISLVLGDRTILPKTTVGFVFIEDTLLTLKNLVPELPRS